MARTHGRKGRPWERLRSTVIAQLFSRGNPTCPGCQAALDPPGSWPDRHPLSLAVDHIVPLSRDPSQAHNPANLRVMHFGCNSARGDGTHQRVSRAW